MKKRILYIIFGVMLSNFYAYGQNITFFSSNVNYDGSGFTPAYSIIGGCRLSTLTFTYSGVSPTTYNNESTNNTTGQPINVGAYNVLITFMDGPCLGTSFLSPNYLILKKALTITATGPAKIYGTALTAGVSSINFTTNGSEVSGEAVTSVTLTPNAAGLSATTAAGASYIVTPSLATGSGGFLESNYDITYTAYTNTITKKPITITAIPGQTKVYGAIDPTNYTYILSTPLIGSDVFTGGLTRVPGETAGLYAISQGTLTNVNYEIAYVGNNFNITKAALTITAEDKSKLYGAAMPALTFSYSGLVNGDLAPTTLPAISTTAVLSSPAGTYPISVSTAADANYTINYVVGTLTVNKVPLIITAENKSKVYGAIDPIFTYTYSGLVNGDLATATWPTILTTALPNSTVGIYPIIPSAATDANYTITYVNGSLTVTKAALTITAKQHTITYNGTAYAGGNGVVPTGLISGETISNLTGTLIYTGTSQGAKNQGSYTISPDGLSSPNYNINFVGGTLEIKKATLNVVAGDQSVNFGTEIAKILNDAVSTYTGLVGGDNASDITGSVTYSTNYTPLTSTGSSGIYLEPIITGLSSTNYDIIAVKGTITITAPPSSPVFQIPNAFTPNSDGHNDTFKIVQNGYVTSIISFRVFTKSGKLIFNDKDGAWDGRYAGIMLDADVYIWIADFINKNNGTEHLSGTVLLLK